MKTDACNRLEAAFRERQSPRTYFPEKPKAKIGAEYPSAEYACWRLAHALHQLNGEAVGPDEAVLLRQVARWCDGPRIPSVPADLLAIAKQQAGVTLEAGGRLIARPFAPAFLHDDCVDPKIGVDIPPSIRRVDQPVPAEPYLKTLQHYDRWYSQAQKEAAWLALTAPPLSTTMIVLPTGAGKSLCFQSVAAQATGLTVVIVPTVALAIDQCRSARKTLQSLNPMYFAANDKKNRPESVVAALERGECRMVFTSPEACVSGRLRPVLTALAEKGQLQNLVLDEAHMVETWGAYFRVDFQLLAALRKSWLNGPNSTLRTFLLSATISPAARSVLKSFYGPDPSQPRQTWREFTSQRLRPEMVYHFHEFANEADRNAAVMDCVWFMPRPAIIYTTERDEAYQLHDCIRKAGFRRTEVFTGDTSPPERLRILEQWREQDSLDLIVATSAFGLGVDKPDVRAVVHACCPENLNRYYQEVGRGGRDGASSICVLLPTVKDFDVAGGMATRLMTPELMQQRWQSMWEDRREISPGTHESEHIWELNPGTQRLGLKGARSWRQNEDWNKRLLLQLERANKLKILAVDTELDANGESIEWIKVEITGFAPESPNVGTLVAPQRAAELDIANAGIGEMRDFMSGEKCVSQVLRKIYGSDTTRVCGGCRHCRRNHRRTPVCPPLSFNTDHSQSHPAVLQIVPNCPSPISQRDAFRPLLTAALRRGIRRFAVAAVHRELLMELAADAVDGSARELYRIDPIDAGVPFDLLPEEDLIAVHIDRPDAQALALRCGKRIAHWLCGGFHMDPRGRYLLQTDGAILFENPNHWLKEG
jgi:ATP-dependent DNA helicase RecQ